MRRTIEGLGALVALGAFVVGIPVALVLRVGWPLPSVAALHLALDLHWFPATLAADLGACVVWAAWAWGTASVLGLAWHHARNRPARLWAGTGWMAPLVSRVVAMVMLAGLSAEAAPAWALPGGAVAAATVPARSPATLSASGPTVVSRSLGAAVVPIAQAGPPAIGAAPARRPATTVALAAPAPMAPAALVHTVVHGDTLWDLAAAHLGDPLRWREIWAANARRAQPGGATFSDPSFLLPGWQLTIPAASTRVPPPAPAPVPIVPAPRAPTTTVPAAATLPTVVPAAPSRLPAGAPAHREGPPAAPPARPAPAGAHAATGTGERTVDVAVPVGLGLAGAAVVLVVAKMRRAQARNRRPGRRIRLPEPPVATVEAALRAGGGAEDLVWLDQVLRLAGHALASAEGDARVVGVVLRAERAELVLDRAAPAPAPMEATGDRWALRRGPDAPALPSSRHLVSPSPALVSMGTTADGAEVLVDLEAMGPLDVGAEPAEAAAIVAAVTAGLAGAPWADGVEIVAFGGLDALLGLDIVVAGDDTTLRSLEARAAQTGKEAAALGTGLARARLVEPGGAWAPTVVVSATTLPEALGARLVELAKQGAGIVAVAPGLPGARPLTVTDGAVELLGETVRPHAASPDMLTGIGALVACAATGGDVAVDDPPYDALERPQAAAVVGVPDGPELWLLGPAELHGHDGPPPRPRVLELLAYVSEHPRGVSSEKIIDALFDGRLKAQKTLYNLMSEARRVLGTNPDGTGRLSASGARWTTIDSDITRFRALAAAGADDRALALVRGRPFEGLGEAAWVTREGHASDVEALVVDVALRCGRRHLDDGDAAGVEAAARAGLRVAPWEERLYALRMQAAQRAGDTTRVRTLFAELCAVVDDDVAPHDDVHPGTEELYRRLLSQSA